MKNEEKIQDSLITEKMARVAKVILRNGRLQDDREASIRLWSYNSLLKINNLSDGELSGYERQVTNIVCEVHASGYTDGVTENDQQIVADIILGMGITFPERKDLLIQAIIDSGSCLDYQAEGILTGLFEIANIGESSVDYDCELFESIAVGSLLIALMNQPSTKCKGRLSKTISEFIQPAWLEKNELHYRLALISLLIKRLESLMFSLSVHEENKFSYFNYKTTLVDEKTMNCLESLSHELCSRLFLESGLSFKMKLIGNSVKCENNKRFAEFESSISKLGL